MVGPKLTKALEWMEKAIKMEAEKKGSGLVDKALKMALQLEQEGIAAGESW